MGKRFVWCFSFVLVFALGFVAGALWQSSTDVPTAVETVAVPTASTLSETDEEAEARIAQALEDPNFKRIHDHLTREQPMPFVFPKFSEVKE